MKVQLKFILVLALVLSSFYPQFVQAAREKAVTFDSWEHDTGPDPRDPMQKELIDILAGIANYPEISKAIMGEQKFRPAYGPVVWRMPLKKNSIKILFIGQDATHIAEAAGRTATAGFGGRAQDFANHFGVDTSAAFINAFAFTIQGQYGAFESPYFQMGADGEADLKKSGIVDNRLWMMTHDPDSPIAQFRNRLIDWIIRNNPDSLKRIILFGGAARDSMATFIMSKGGKVEARMSDEFFKKVQVPETKLEFAGANNEYPVPYSKSGGDLYSEVAGKRLKYSNAKDVATAEAIQKNQGQTLFNQMVFTQAGPYQNGLVSPAQLGGYNLDRISINGQITRSLMGLPLDDKTKIKSDILVVEFPHPSALSRLTPKEASERVAKALKALEPYEKEHVIPDPGFVNKHAKGIPYKYSRAQLSSVYFDFGAPGTRMVPVSTASRMTKNAHVIIFGTREKAQFNMDHVAYATKAGPSEYPDEAQMYTARARTLNTRYVFDAGPGEFFARLMKENLDLEAIFKPKEGMSFENNGIDAYNVKTHPDVSDFGHYRGTFNNPKVFILADPDGADDLITARALTGSRGQYLQGLMKEMGIAEEYLVLKTVPFGMEDATAEEWKIVLEKTEQYREKVINAVLDRNPNIELILTDGPAAKIEMERILAKRGKSAAPIISIKRTDRSNNSGLDVAAKEIAQLPKFKSLKSSGKMSNIPRSHLTYYARLWEGTSGDRILDATDKYKGLAFAEVAPEWAWSQKIPLNHIEQAAVNKMLDKMDKSGLMRLGESVPQFLERKEQELVLMKKKNSQGAAAQCGRMLTGN